MPAIPIRNLLAGQTLSPDERARLLRAASRLIRDAREGRHGLPLTGRHVAISADHPIGAPACDLEAAAAGLGARVSVIGPRELVGASDRTRLGRMLGSLYDAVDCDALSPDQARELQRISGVLVFDGLAGEGHPLKSLVPALQELERDLSANEALASLLKAALVATMS